MALEGRRPARLGRIAWMNAENLLAFNTLLVMAILSPGPAFLVALRISLARGRRAGLMTGLGLALIATMWTGAALWGLDALFHLFPVAWSLARGLGGAYLLWLAWKLWRDAAKPIDDKTGHRPGRNRNALLLGIGVNLLNPKSVLFAGAVLLVVFPAALSGPEKVLVMANQLALELLFYAGIAFGLGHPRPRAIYFAAMPLFERGAAVLLGFFGLRLLFGSAGTGTPGK